MKSEIKLCHNRLNIYCNIISKTFTLIKGRERRNLASVPSQFRDNRVFIYLGFGTMLDIPEYILIQHFLIRVLIKFQTGAQDGDKVSIGNV